MSFKKFSQYFVFIITIFILLNIGIWYFYTQKILTREDNLATGDLTRMGYISNLTHERKNSIDLSKLHFSNLDSNIEYDVINIGDSFSQGNGWGKNRFYQDYLASHLNWNVLNLTQYNGTKNPIEMVTLLLNSGFLDKYKTKYILIESTQRQVVQRFSYNETYPNKSTLLDIETFYTNQPKDDFKLPEVTFINNGNFKFVLYNFLYNFSDRAFFSNVHKVKLSKEFFSIGSGKDLLYYHMDITSIKKNTQNSLKNANTNLNNLSALLNKKGVKLIFMPIVTKYDMYSDWIINNKQPKDPFFDIFRTLDKKYIFIDTKAILLDELKKGEKDIFYCDDTHWGYKASEAITHHFSSLLSEPLLNIYQK